MKTIITTILLCSFLVSATDKDVYRCNKFIASLTPDNPFQQFSQDNPDHPRNVKFREETILNFTEALEKLKTDIIMNVVPKSNEQENQERIMEISALIHIIKQNASREKTDPVFKYENDEYCGAIIARIHLSDWYINGRTRIIVKYSFKDKLNDFMNGYFETLEKDSESYTSESLNELFKKFFERDYDSNISLEKKETTHKEYKKLLEFANILKNTISSCEDLDMKSEMKGLLADLENLQHRVCDYFRLNPHYDQHDRIIKPAELQHILNSIKDKLNNIKSNESGLDALQETEKMLFSLVPYHHPATLEDFYLQSIYTKDGISYIKENLFWKLYSYVMEEMSGRNSEHARSWILRDLKRQLDAMRIYSAFAISPERYEEIKKEIIEGKY